MSATAPALREPAQRVSPRARWLWIGTALAQAAVLAGMLLAVEVLTPLDVPWWAWPPLGAVLVAHVAVVPQWRYLVHRWEVTDTAVYTQTGWWLRERRVAPMSRIQTVEYAESALGRLLRLAEVRATTASAAGDLVIDGLDAARARALVEELTRRADAVPGDAT